jgi:hypothetical protein
MGVNYASVITWPTNDELRERQRMIQIRKNELRRKSTPCACCGSPWHNANIWTRHQ